MSSLPPSKKPIRELNLEDSDEITLYIELIRIIERDIDDIQARDTRNGWSSWAIAAGIGAALLAFFGETRKLGSFPVVPVELICLAGVQIYALVVLAFKLLSLDQVDIRPGKLRWSNEAYLGFMPSAIFTLLLFIACIIIAISLALPLAVKLFTAAAFGLMALSIVLVLVLARMALPLGNNPTIRKGGLIFAAAPFFTSVVSAIGLISQLRWPVGEDATLPYALAGIILVVLLLSGRLIFRMVPSRLLAALKDLRNEIVFFRLDIDEALKRYEVLSEGETFPDAIQKELGEVLADLNVLQYAHWNMRRLIQQMMQKLPLQDDSAAVREKKIADINLDKDSYLLHDQRCSQIMSAIGVKITALTNKMKRVIVATQDWGSDNMIRTSLTQRLQLMQQAETKLRKRREAIDYYLANPDKIPVIPKVEPNESVSSDVPGRSSPDAAGHQSESQDKS